MRTNTWQATIFLSCLLFTIFITHSQKQGLSRTELLTDHKDALADYDKATAISLKTNYTPADEALEEKLNRSALKGFKKLYDDLAHTLPVYDSLKLITAYKIGELNHYFDALDEALMYYNEAIKTGRKILPGDSVLFKPQLYAGLIYYQQNRFDSALTSFTAAEDIQKRYHYKLQEGERLFNMLGVLYYEQGNYRQAQNYFQKALEVLQPSHPSHRELFVNYQINLAQLFLKLEEYEKAHAIYAQLLPLQIHLNEINHNLGTLNLSLGAAQKALSYFRKVKYNNNKVVRLYSSMGNAFFNLNQFDSAKLYYAKALNFGFGEMRNKDAIGLGLAQKGLADYYVKIKNFDSALFYYQAALKQFYPSFANQKVGDNPETFTGIFSYINLFSTLTAKAEAWHQHYLQHGTLEAAEKELAAYTAAFKLIEYVERTYDSDEARLFLTKIKYAAHNQPIDIAFELYRRTKDEKYLAALYGFDQQNKAAVLALGKHRAVGRKLNATPLVQQETEIKKAITRLSIKAAGQTDSGQLNAINTDIRNHEIALGNIQEKLNQEANGPTNIIPTIGELQKNILDEDVVLISYHLSEAKLTTLVITKKKISCFQQNLPDDFLENITAYLAQLKTTQAFHSSPSLPGIYQLLMQHVPLQQFKKLIIIPDDVLNFLPFESLQDKEGKYLVQKLSIQYQYCTALLKKEAAVFSGEPVLAFAPFADNGRGNLQRLNYSRQEIEQLEGRKLYGGSATKTAFVNEAPNYKTLHLATHAAIDSAKDELSFVAFGPKDTDGFLYASEIENLDLHNTKLVILSACETNTGNLVKGEGVLSLSRAFSLAGCANIITSLWKANDFSTAYLTGRIHLHLKQDKTIAEAVQLAKLDYLQDKTIHPRLKHPSYWSHLVFIGNYQSPKTNKAWLFIVAGLLTVMLAFLFIKKSRKAGPR